MTDTIVIAGAGHAAGQTAISLRQGGFDGRIVMVGDEPYPPYQRPPLSKKFLAGELPLERLFLRPEQFYAKHDIELQLGTRVSLIHRGQHEAELDDGSRLSYSKLVIATGSRVRRLEFPGSDLPGVHYLRSIDDVLAMQTHFKAGARLIVMGAGYIGLEVAAVAVQAGLDVMVREIADRVMARVVSPEVSSFYDQVHRDAGVHLILNSPANSTIHGDGRVESVRDHEGQAWPADFVVIGVGVLPNVELAEQAGLACDNGIVVDDCCRTEDADILAIGDCTSHPNSILGRQLRLESVHNAQEQAKTAAATILGNPQAYAQVPWFWSDQYDLKLQIVGLATPDCQRIVRGDPAQRSFAVLHLLDNRLQAVEAVNSAREFMLGKKLIAAGVPLDPQALADNSRNFKDIATAALG
jgi:3-phenylpropionate/trans-cinnamate dioxygenase ferredoxin reductase subunit